MSLCVVSQSLASVAFVTQRPPPPFVFKIPFNRLAQTAIEGLFGKPSEFTLNLARVDGVTLVVTGAVIDVVTDEDDEDSQ